MKTTDRLADLEERVRRLEARNAEVECIEREIVQAMRQYARLDSLGYDVDADGVRSLYCQSDIPMQKRRWLERAQELSMQLLRAETA